MQISARSYLTAGVALSAASAIALAPVVVPTNDRAITVPSISTSDVQLAAVINPADVEKFIASLEGALQEVVNAIDTVAGAPGLTVLETLAQAAELNETLWETLIAAAGGVPALQGLLTGLANTSKVGFNNLLATVDDADIVVSLLPGQITTIIGSGVIYSVGSVLLALTQVVNEPLNPRSYTTALGTGVDIVGYGIQDGIDVVNTLAATLLGGYPYSDDPGLLDLSNNLVRAQFNTVFTGLNNILAQAASLSGSQIVEGLVQAIQGVSILPVLTIVNSATGATSTSIEALRDGFFSVTTGVAHSVDVVQSAIYWALDDIGSNPLDPRSYTAALAEVIGGGFGLLDEGLIHGSTLLKIPANLAAGLTSASANLVAGLTAAMAHTASGLLTAAGLPPEIAEIPREIAGAIISVIDGARDLAVDAATAVNNTIDAVANTALDLSLEAETAIRNVLHPNPHPVPVYEDDEDENDSLTPQAIVPTLETESTADLKKELSASAEDASTDTDSEAGAGSNTETKSKRELVKEKREAAKAEREATRAERTEKRSAARADRAEKRAAVQAERTSASSGSDNSGSDSSE